MIPLLLSIASGVGLWLIYEGLTAPRLSVVSRGPTGRITNLLLGAGLRDVTPRSFVMFSVAAGALSAAVAQLLLGWTSISMLAALLGATAPFLYYSRRRDRRQATLQEALAEAIAHLRDSIRAGFSVQEALAGLARSAPEALRPEFATLAREMRLVGFEPALNAMRERLADPLFDVVAVNLVLNDRLGGRNVTQVLDRLVHATREQLRVQQELRAYQARNVTSARVIAVMPLVVLFLIRRVNPDYLEVFSSWWGQLLLAGCALSIGAGYLLMLRLTRLPGERRVLK